MRPCTTRAIRCFKIGPRGGEYRVTNGTVFLSYNRRDRSQVVDLAEGVLATGSVWFDAWQADNTLRALADAHLCGKCRIVGTLPRKSCHCSRSLVSLLGSTTTQRLSHPEALGICLRCIDKVQP